MPLRNDLVNSKLYDTVHVTGRRASGQKLVLTGATTLSETVPPIVLLDCNGAARNVTLPLFVKSKGLLLKFRNMSGGAFAATIKDEANTTIGTLNQNATGEFWCDGAAWYQIGD